VAILSRGRLVRCGTMQELTASRQPSIEVVGLGTGAAIVEQASRLPGLISAIPTPHGVNLILSGESAVEVAVAFVRQAGGRLVSVNPSRASLEDLFFEQSF